MYSKNKIAEILGVDRKTLGNWEKDRPTLYKIVIDHFEKQTERPDLNDIEFIKKEINEAIDKIPKQKAKKFYHLIMAELAEMGH